MGARSLKKSAAGFAIVFAGIGVPFDSAEFFRRSLEESGALERAVLFLNDGAGRFARDPGAFRFAKGLQGAPMSMAMADYDRDGFLDLYLSVYSYHYGAGEAKAGTPTPYYEIVTAPGSAPMIRNGAP